MPETATDGSSPSTLETPATAGALLTEGPGGGEAGSDANPAGSSAADEGAKPQPKALLDVVKDAVAKTQAEEGASPGPKSQEGSSEGKPAAGKADGAEPVDDDASVPFHKHPRWQAKVAESKKLKGDLKGLTEQVAQLRGASDQFGVIEKFRTDHGISVEEVVAGFRTMALIKTDPAKALPELRKIVSTLELAIGERLPEDLQEQVDKGAIDEASAKETAKLRAANKRLAQTVDQSQHREQERAVGQVREAIRSTVSGWEAERKAADPDWSEKQELVRKEVLATVQETGRTPATPEDALALAKQAYETVSKTFARLRPAPRRTAPAPASGTSATGAKPQPKTLLEVARQAAAA